MGDLIRIGDFQQDTPIEIKAGETTIRMSVADVLKWVEPKAPPQECLKFLMTCKHAGMNPLLGEAYLVNMGGKYATVISKAGYLKRAQSQPDFDGIEAGITVQKKDGNNFGEPVDVEGSILPRGFVLVGAWARVYRRDFGRPFTSRLSMAEYAKSSPTWDKMACTMIRKTAIVHAIREAYGIGDSYDEAEAPPAALARAAARVVERPAPEAVDAEVEPEVPAHLERLYALVHRLRMSQAKYNELMDRFGVRDAEELDAETVNLICLRLEGGGTKLPFEADDDDATAPAA